MRRLALLTIAFIVADSILFAAISVSPQPLLAFPIVVTLWVLFLIVLIKQATATFSAPPHVPRRVMFLTVIACAAAIAALAAAIIVGVILFRAAAPE
jgi:hypothetical protein